MSDQYRLLVKPDVRRQFVALSQAAASQPDSLRGRELHALKLGLRALAEGREAEYDGKRLGFSPNHHDLRDCAEIKLDVIPESRSGRDLGASHRLLYREFEAEDGGPPYREVVCFEPRRGDRPFIVAANRLDRTLGVAMDNLSHLRSNRPTVGPQQATGPIAPPRLPLPPDLRKALAVASNVAPAAGAVTQRPHIQRPATGQDRGNRLSREL